MGNFGTLESIRSHGCALLVHTSAVARNQLGSSRLPIGVIFDPEDIVARYAAGEPIETLTARPSLSAGMGPFDMLWF